MPNDPSTAEEWMAVAWERGADATALLPSRASSIGPVYMAGYAIECAIKGYLQHKGIPRPANGHEGHNLRGIWKSMGFCFADLKDSNGNKSFFIEHWSTDFRYQANYPANVPNSTDLVSAAKGLVGWIHAQIKRQRRTI